MENNKLSTNAAAELLIVEVIQAFLWSGFCVYLAVYGHQYEMMYKDFGMTLPKLTAFFVDLPHLIRHQWPLAVGAIVVWTGVSSGIGCAFNLLPSPAGRYAWYTLVVLLPLACCLAAPIVLQLPMQDLMEHLSSGKK